MQSISLREKKILPFIGVLLLYIAFGTSALYIATINKFVSPVWPASGLAVFAVFYFGNWISAAIFLGAFFVNYFFGAQIVTSLAIAGGNTLEAVVGGAVLDALLKNKILRNYAELVSVHAVAFLSTAISASIGISAIGAVGGLEKENRLFTWYTWWSGDAIGIFVLLPFFLSLLKEEEIEYDIISLFKHASQLLMIVGITFLIMMEKYNQAYSWILAPILLLAGMFIGHKKTRFALTIIALVVVYSIHSGMGPFEFSSRNFNLIYGQGLIYTYSLAALLASAISIKFYSNWKFSAIIASIWMGITLVIYFVSNEEMKRVEEDLSDSASSIQELILTTANQYALLLDASAGIVQMYPGLNIENWKRFIQPLNLEEGFPAINGVGFIRSFTREEYSQWLRRYEADFGKGTFVLKDLDKNLADQHSDILPITMVEPIEKNKQALGLNIGSEWSRREAAELSKKMSKIVATRPIQLVQDNKSRPGFLILRPIWLKNANGEKTQFYGWSYFPVIAETFFKTAIGHISNYFDLNISVMGKDIYTLNHFHNEAFEKNIYSREMNIEIFHLEYKIKLYPTSEYFSKNKGVSVLIAFMLTILVFLILGFVVEQHAFQLHAEELVRIRSEELEISRAKLMESSKMSSLGEMAGGVAHEINNPLAIIFAKTTQLKLKLESGALEKNKCIEELSKIEKTASRISKIVRGLKMFSRNADNDPFEEIKVSRIIEDTLELCAEKFKKNAIQIKVLGETDFLLQCRSAQISQVLMNLLSNSFDAIHELQDKWIEIEVTKFQSKVAIFIRDSGNGIPEHVVKKLMQPFFTTKEVGKGTGLGLSISRGITESHGGELRYKKDNNHTCFILELPLRQVESKERAA